MHHTQITLYQHKIFAIIALSQSTLNHPGWRVILRLGLRTGRLSTISISSKGCPLSFLSSPWIMYIPLLNFCVFLIVFLSPVYVLWRCLLPCSVHVSNRPFAGATVDICLLHINFLSKVQSFAVLSTLLVSTNAWIFPRWMCCPWYIHWNDFNLHLWFGGLYPNEEWGTGLDNTRKHHDPFIIHYQDGNPIHIWGRLRARTIQYNIYTTPSYFHHKYTLKMMTQ